MTTLRFSALSRCYEYRVTDAPYGADPLCSRYTLSWPRPLDLPALLGRKTHDLPAEFRREVVHRDDLVLLSQTS